MNESNLEALGATVLRISLGLVLLAHSAYLKLLVFTLPGTAGYFESIGLPAALAYLTFAVETAAGAALIAGYRVRIAALAVIPVLLGATWVHSANGWLFNNEGGGWEYPLFLTAAAVVQALIGSGRGAFSRLAGDSVPPIGVKG